MKKIILGIIIGILLSGTIVYAANYLYHADEVSYTPSNSNWNVDSVDKALDDLYEKSNKPSKTGQYEWDDITSYFPTISSFGTYTSSTSLSKYKKFYLILQNGTCYCDGFNVFCEGTYRPNGFFVKAKFTDTQVVITSNNVEWTGQTFNMPVKKIYATEYKWKENFPQS